MHLDRLACASFDRCGLLVVEAARTWAYPSIDGAIRIDQTVQSSICIPSCLSHLCYPHLGQPLRDQIVDFPGWSALPRIRVRELYHLA